MSLFEAAAAVHTALVCHVLPDCYLAADAKGLHTPKYLVREPKKKNANSARRYSHLVLHVEKDNDFDVSELTGVFGDLFKWDKVTLGEITIPRDGKSIHRVVIRFSTTYTLKSLINVVADKLLMLREIDSETDDVEKHEDVVNASSLMPPSQQPICILKRSSAPDTEVNLPAAMRH
jgi:hypothetical protein